MDFSYTFWASNYCSDNTPCFVKQYEGIKVVRPVSDDDDDNLLVLLPMVNDNSYMYT